MKQWRKIMAITLSVSLLLSCMAVFGASASAETGWKVGTTQTFETMSVGTNVNLAGGTGTLAVATAVNHTAGGGKSLELTSNANAGGVRPQMTVLDGEGNIVKLNPKYTYKISFWIYRPASSSTAAINYWFCSTKDEAGFTATAQKNATVLQEVSNVNTEKDAWKKIETVVSPADWTKAGVDFGEILRFGIAAANFEGAMNTYYLDDFTVEIETGTTSNYDNRVVNKDGEGNVIRYESTSNGQIYGNGSGREISDKYDHTTGNGNSARLKMNQQGSFANTVIQGSGNTLAYPVTVGQGYAVSAWVYWDPSENEGADGVAKPSEASSTELTYSLTSCKRNDAVFTTNINVETSKTTNILANTWTKVNIYTFALAGVEGGPENQSLCFGAYTPNCSTSNIYYLYVDDITIIPMAALDVNGAIDSPDAAALFCTENEGSQFDPAAVAGSATYFSESRNKEYAAMRVFGDYPSTNLDPTEASVAGYDFDVVERGVLLGSKDSTEETLTLDGVYLAKSSASGSALKNVWSLGEQGTSFGSRNVRFSLLLKNIPQAKIKNGYTFRSYLKLGTKDAYQVFYSDIKTDLTLESVYNAACEASGKTLGWFGTNTEAPASDVITFNDGFDARYAVVYADGNDAAKAAAENIATALDTVSGAKVAPVSDADVADEGGYEILVGDTNRAASTAAKTGLTANNYDYKVVVNGKKLALVSKSDEGLTMATTNFIASYLTRTAGGFDPALNVKGSDKWANAPKINGNAISNYKIVVEKYPSLITLKAAEAVQAYVAAVSGVKLDIVKYNGTNYNYEIQVGPKNGSVKAHFDNTHYDIKSGLSTEMRNSSGDGYLVSVDDGGFLKDCTADEYKITVDGNTLKINGGSVYAINAGALRLGEMLLSNNIGDQNFENYADSTAYTPDGDHEDDGVISWEETIGNEAIASRDFNHGNMGKKSLKISSVSWDAVNRAQVLLTGTAGDALQVQAGNNYNISFWVLWPEENASDYFRFWLATNDEQKANLTKEQKNANLIYEASGVSDIQMTPNTWTKIDVNITNCASTGYLVMGAAAGGANSSSAVFYLDDIKVTGDGDYKNGFAFKGAYDKGYSLTEGYSLVFGDDFNYDYDDEFALFANWNVSTNTTAGPTEQWTLEAGETITVDGKEYVLTSPLVLWDEQQRPAIYGKDGTYYCEGGYLWEITKYVVDMPTVGYGTDATYIDENETEQTVRNAGTAAGIESMDGYWAGRVISDGRWTYSYGYAEVRMVMATRNGACSAVWNPSATSDKETDIHPEFDWYENFGRDLVRANYHAWNGNVSHQYYTKSGNGKATWPAVKGSDLGAGEHFYDTFHYIGCDWTDTDVTFYLDGESIGSLNISQLKGNDALSMQQEVKMWLANGVGTQNYCNGYDPDDYLEDPSNFKETQVIDYAYLFQKDNDYSVFNDKR